MPVTIETYQEFAQRHPGKPIRVGYTVHKGSVGGHIKVGGQFVFPDGAAVSPDNRDVRSEPPDNPAELLRVRHAYHKEWLARAERDFNQLKNALMGAVERDGLPMTFTWPEEDYGPAPTERDPRYGTPDGAVALSRLKAIVEEHRKAVADLEQQYADLPAVKAAREKQATIDQMRREEADRAARDRQLISQITL
jgi:hypothetical protein